MPASSDAYRDPKADEADEDEDDDDLDDLDDVLASFNKPSTATPAKRPAPGDSSSTIPPSNPPPASTSVAALTDSAPAENPLAATVSNDDLDADLEAGMEELLRSLALSNPPGPMPDILAAAAAAAAAPSPAAAGAAATASGAAGPSRSTPRSGAGAGAGAGAEMTAEEEERAWQRAMEMLLSQDGIEALGLNDPSARAAAGSGAGPSSSRTPGAGPSGALPPPPSFEETIRRAMEGINAGGASAAAAAGEGEDADHAAGLAKLLQQLAADPAALGDDDDDLGGLLDGMMTQLMSKEVLEEPMVELSSKYPGYLASPPAGVSKEDLEKYKSQHRIVQQIVDTFRRDGYSDDRDGKEIARLVGEMQDLGGPPKEIMGDLPEGLDLGALGALGGGEDCLIM